MQLLINVLERLSGINPLTRQSFSLTDIEKMTEVRNIITSDLSKSYSILELAKKVATNECTLKRCSNKRLEQLSINIH